MKGTAIQFYALAVCFSALMCFVIALGIGLYDLVRIGAPDFTIQQWQRDVYMSNERFLASFPDKKSLEPAEITQLRERMHHDALAAERRAAEQSAVFVAIIIVIDAIVFAAHWRLARSSSSVLP